MRASLTLAWIAAGACAGSGRPTVPVVQHVDLERFMGTWFVIASIPTRFERGAHNAVEAYELDADGTIQTTFTYRKGGFDGAKKTYRPRGVVRDRRSNAVWGMRLVWPFYSEYVISYLSPDYSETIVARSKRDHVWIMARTPTITEERYRALVARVADLGYDVARLRRVPQRWPDVGAAVARP